MTSGITQNLARAALLLSQGAAVPLTLPAYKAQARGLGIVKPPPAWQSYQAIRKGITPELLEHLLTI